MFKKSNKLIFSHDPYIDGMKPGIHSWLICNRSSIFAFFISTCLAFISASFGYKMGFHDGVIIGAIRNEVSIIEPRTDGSLHPAIKYGCARWWTGIKDSLSARKSICGENYSKEKMR